MPNRADLDSKLTADRSPGSDRRSPERGATQCGVNFQAVFECAPDVYLVLAPDPPRFTILAANEARVRATGMRRDDVIGQALFAAFPDNPADPNATGVRNLRASLNEVLRTGRPHRMALQKYDIRNRDGEFEERYWQPLNSPVFDGNGKLIHIIHRVEDVTDTVHAGRRMHNLESITEKLGASEGRLRLLVDMIPQNIWTTDAVGRHTYFSRRWYDFTGAAPEESHGEGWLDFIHPDDRVRTLARWQHSLDTGEPYEIEYRFRGGDGEYRWFLGKAMPLRNEAGEIIEWFGTATDISEHKRLEHERERLAESRARLMRGFSHDVKNPLGAADGYAALLEEGIGGELSEEQRESVTRIRRSINTSLRLIHDLLELVRAESGQIDVECITTDVDAVACEAADDFRAQAKAVGLTLRCDTGTGALANTDPTRVRQILANLLSNAVKYAPKGTVTVETSARSSGGPRPGPWITASVTDTGPGIPAVKQESIVQEFTRLDPTAQPGAGVGLAISRRIARILGGDLTVESEVGRGASFVLWLPRAKSAAA